MSAPPSLPSPFSMAGALRQHLPSFGQIEWKMTTGSTNADLLAREWSATPSKPWLLGAHLQRTGRGRAGRIWKNQLGTALMFSCAFDTTLPPAMLPVLSPLAGLAACEALREMASLTCDALQLKWPNDVLWNNAKLAGVLVETRRDLGTLPNSHTVVVGMGLNLCDRARLSQELGRPIADWCQVGTALPPAELVAGIAQAWQTILIDVHHYGFGAFVERFQKLNALKSRQVQVIDQGIIRHQGIAQGVDTHGRLIVHTPTGPVSVSVGDVSIR